MSGTRAIVEQKKEERGLPCRVNERGMLGFKDDDLMRFPRFVENVKHARFRKRDEKNRITWVCDEFLGLSTNYLRVIPKN